MLNSVLPPFSDITGDISVPHTCTDDSRFAQIYLDYLCVSLLCAGSDLAWHGMAWHGITPQELIYAAENNLLTDSFQE